MFGISPVFPTPKAVKGSWNSTGCHTYYSSVDEAVSMFIICIIDKLPAKHSKPILRQGQTTSHKQVFTNLINEEILIQHCLHS
jgi:hypothetical protein